MKWFYRQKCWQLWDRSVFKSKNQHFRYCTTSVRKVIASKDSKDCGDAQRSVCWRIHHHFGSFLWTCWLWLHFEYPGIRGLSRCPKNNINLLPIARGWFWNLRQYFVKGLANVITNTAHWEFMRPPLSAEYPWTLCYLWLVSYNCLTLSQVTWHMLLPCITLVLLRIRERDFIFCVTLYFD